MSSKIPDGSRDASEEHYKRTFATSKQLEEMEEAAADEHPDDSTDETKKKAAGSLKKQENQPDKASWKTDKLGERDKTLRKQGMTGRLRHGSAYAFVIGLILTGVWYSSVFAPNIIMVNIKEMFTNDLADATVALWTYDKKMLDHKLGAGKAQCSQQDSIECKLSTMSRLQVKALEKAGFVIQGNKVEEDNLDDDDPDNDLPESRFIVTSIEFPHDGGTANNADQFEENTNKSSAMKALVYSVFHPKTSFFMDERYEQRIKWRYDLSKSPIVDGDTEEEVDASFDAAMRGDDEKIDKANHGAFGLNTLASDEGKQGLREVANELGSMANSYTQLQCAMYTQGKIVTNDTKKAKETSVARFAMQYLKAADQIKAGMSNEIVPNVLSSKLAWSWDGGYAGRNATDSAMYRHILFNEQPKDSESGIMFYLDAFDAIGALIEPWRLISTTARDTRDITDAPGALIQTPADIGNIARQYCLDGQTTASKEELKPESCPDLTRAAAPPEMKAVVSPIADSSQRICPPPDQGQWQMYPTTRATAAVLMPYIAERFNIAVGEWATEVADDFTSETRGPSASDALFAGTGAILGDMAMSRGMRPGNKQTMPDYIKLGEKIDKELEEVARYKGKKNPFDIQNKFSFMGALVRTLGVSHDQKSPFLSYVSNLLSLLPTSLKHLNPESNAFFYIQPRELDESRLRCPDAEYLSIGIDADVACNVRYSMSQQELDADPQTVIDYMLESHPDETEENIQDLSERLATTDPERDAGEVGRMLREAQEGSNATMIDETTGAPVKFSEYEKFMTYCVNREDPWGRSGLAVRREELTEEEKDARRLDKDQDGDPVNKATDSGNPYELRLAKDETGRDAIYMSVTEGAEADQLWYTGEKCLEDSEMLRNFRAYTMMCMVDGSHSGAPDCTERDHARGYYFDGFYNNNDIIYTSWY